MFFVGEGSFVLSVDICQQNRDALPLMELRSTGDDRIVVVPNYTQSRDLMRIMCRETSW